MSDIWNFIWIFIILVTFLPVLQQKILNAKRITLMRRLEAIRKFWVITLIHRRCSTYQFRISLPRKRRGNKRIPEVSW